jgi:deoxycytidylate deaminase
LVRKTSGVSKQIRRKLRKYTINIVRTNISPESGELLRKGLINDDEIEYIYLNASPCSICINMLMYYGIKKVIFTKENGEIIQKKLSKFSDKEKTHLSDAQKNCVAKNIWK